MIYEAEKTAASLKAAREKKGLSQRKLSARTGVPQSHISKIEVAGVDLRISSLVALANALGLEFVLVPRKAMPAVNSIIRSAEDVPKGSPETRRVMDAIGRQIETLSKYNLDRSVVDGLQRQFRQLKQMQNLLRDTDTLRQIRKTLKGFKEAGGIETVRQAEEQIRTLRNTLAHTRWTEPASMSSRPAYRLDGDDLA